MTDILINWLNNDIRLSRKVVSNAFAEDFSNGYLLGEILFKCQLQEDFDQFSQNRTSESKLNNFTRLEPILNLLGIPFDTNRARDIMTEKYGEATKLVYQLFIALNRKQKAGLTGTAMETMRPAAPAKLDYMKSLIYKERLKHLTPRQADLNLESLQNEFNLKAVKLEKTAFRLKMEEEERIHREVQKRRLDLMDKRRQVQAQMAERIAKIHAAKVDIPTPPARTLELIRERKEIRTALEVKSTQEDIAKFETRLAAVLPPSKGVDPEDVANSLRQENVTPVNELDYLKPKSNHAYINKIRKRLNEDASARSEREKRRRKVLVEQQRAHEAQEESRREEMLVNRLMRQSQQERRIAVQLLQARHEKDVIKQNRLYREQQYEERRLREFEEALNRESELARLAKLDYVEQIKKDQEQHAKIAAERAEASYTRHYNLCNDVLSEIVNVACKVGEYRELTENLVPAKLWREWKSLFVAGRPLYDTAASGEPAMNADEPTPADVLEAERQAVLNEGDFQEYKDMMGEWSPPEDSGVVEPPAPNPVVGHVINRLFNMVHPPTPPPMPPEFPAFPIKACVLGKSFCGKSSVAKKLASSHRLATLNVDDLVRDAIESYKNNESALNQPESGGKSGSIAEGATSEKEKQKADNLPDANNAKGATEKDKKSKKDESGMTTRAKLGAKAIKLLKRGKPVDDQLSVDILTDAIRSIPEGTGWLIDGFPSTYPQAKLLEKALSGFDANLNDEVRLKTSSRMRENKTVKDKSIAKSKNSRLAPDPKPPAAAPEPTSAINVVVLLDVPDDVCLKRSAGRAEAQLSQTQYHQEFNPPPEGSITGVQNQEQVTPVVDPAYDEQQIQARITGFLDNWPRLEKWFTKFDILKKIDATMESTSVFLETENIIEDTLDRLLKRGKYEPAPEPEPEPVIVEPEPEPPREPTPPPPPPPEQEEEPRSTSQKGSAKGKGDRSPAKSSGKKSEAKQGSGKASGKDSIKKGKKSKTPEVEPEPEAPPEPVGTPPPAPGSEFYEYVDQPLEIELAQCLVPHWEAIENTYIETSKHVFQDIRTEKEKVIRYFYNIRKDYLKFLRRPDSKQDFIDQWVAEYNSVPDDMRSDEETMAELHQKVDDLRERLWTICDERKVQAETERQDIIDDGWLEDGTGIICNHYITQMQGEVDRFQDTVQLLKDYYKGMEGQIPDEARTDLARLPLVELPVIDTSGAPEVSGEFPTQEIKQASPVPDEENPRSPKGQPSPRSTTPKGGKKPRGRSAKKEDEPAAPESPTPEVQPGRRIPLMPRNKPGTQPDSEVAPSATPGKGDAKKDKGAKSKKSNTALPEEKPESPTMLSSTKDPDEKLIIESHENGIKALSSIVAQEEALKQAAEEAELEAAMVAAAEKEKAGKADKKAGDKKKGKSRSPSPKKGGKGGKTPVPAAPTAPTPPPSEESEEEKEKKRLKVKAREEFFAAIKLEESACKIRLDLIKAVATKSLVELKDKADNVYKDMNDWLGARFLKEMESIDHMSEKMRHAIESRDRISNHIVLVQEDFLIAEDIRTYKTPSPPPRPEPEEEAHIEFFTIKQLMTLYAQFKLVAEDGVISVKNFIDIFHDFTSLAHGMESLPDSWMNVQLPQIQELASMLSFDGEYINWKAFMVAVSQPIMLPSNEQLIETLQKFQAMDQKATGYVTREQYDRMDLWFDIERMPTPADSSHPYQYNRMENLKASLFDFFANHISSPSKLYYKDMLLYFSVDSDAFEGLLRALGTVSTTLISTNDDIPISIDALYEVLHHGEGQATHGDSHRFSLPPEQDKSLSMEKLETVYHELCGDIKTGLPFRVLLEHPIVQDCVNKFSRFKQAELRLLFYPTTPNIVATVGDMANLEMTSNKE